VDTVHQSTNNSTNGAADQKVGSPVVQKRNGPIVTRTSEGIKIEDKDGYYRIVKSYAEATPIVKQLVQYRNSVIGMNGFESAKWKAPKG
jgi:hypothetical protein